MTKDKITETVKEYAAALFMLSLEEQKQEEFSGELTLADEILRENPEYLEFLSNPAIGIDERILALDKAFSSFVSGYVMNFLKLLCENNRIIGFEDCRKEYERLYMEYKKSSIAKVTSATLLTKEETEKLRFKLEEMSGHSITIENTQDSSLIGGLVIELDGKVIDGSVKEKLRKVKEVIRK